MYDWAKRRGIGIGIGIGLGLVAVLEPSKLEKLVPDNIPISEPHKRCALVLDPGIQFIF